MTDTSGQTEGQTKPATAPARKRGGRPRKARGAATSADKAAARWTVRGVPLNVREIASKGAENRGMTVGDWISEAVVAFSKADTNRVSADVPTVALLDDMKDMKARLTKLESRDTRGLLGKLFGKGSAAAVLLAVFLIGGSAWAVKVNYKSFGYGSESCGGWTAAKEEDGWEREVSNAWVAGYLTAYSLWEENGSGPVTDENNAVGANAWVDNYCQKTSLDAVADAAVKLIYAIIDRRRS